MADITIAGPITTPHAVEECYGSTRHCFSHDADEPLKGFRWCFECGHMFLTAEELLAGHNKHLAVYGIVPETDVREVRCCPHCIHDW